MATGSEGLLLSADHEALRQSIRAFLQVASAEEDVRRVMESAAGLDPSVWSRLAGELGALGMAVPEDRGGAGFGFVEVGVLLEEAGRALLVAPLLSTLIATATLLASDDIDAQSTWLPAVVAGESTATVALPPIDAGPTPVITATAGGTLSGVLSYVLDGHTADVIIVPAQGRDGLALYLVEGSATGLTRTVQPTADLTRRLASLTMRGTPSVRLVGDGDALLGRARIVAAVLLGAEQVGAAEGVLERTVDYAKERKQFGRAIGSFQAVKHRLADILVDVELARAVLYRALWCLDHDDPDLPVEAATVKALCSDAFLTAAGDSIQVHGGIGFTWEHPAHLYFKRAKLDQLLFGDPGHHRVELAGLLGL